MEPEEHTFCVDVEDEGARLDQYLASRIADISRARVHSLILSKNATIDGHPAKPSHKVRSGESIRIVIEPRELPSFAPEDIALDIIFEDEHIIIVNKPAGMVVHPAAGSPSGTLVNALLHHSAELSRAGGEDRPGIVHRLDKKTSGLLVVAKNETAHRRLSESLERRDIKRKYQALAYESFTESEGSIDAPIGRSPSDRKKMVVGGLGNREALTHFTVLEELNDASRLAVRLSTGRTHQIRVHMAYIGHPILGDPTYGTRLRRFHDNMPVRVVQAIERLKGQMLHSESLEFDHPITGEHVRFEAPPPKEFERLIRLLGKPPAS